MCVKLGLSFLKNFQGKGVGPSSPPSLNGDDVPLCEEVMTEMVRDDGDKDRPDGQDRPDDGINGDNFFGAVVSANKEYMLGGEGKKK